MSLKLASARTWRLTMTCDVHFTWSTKNRNNILDATSNRHMFCNHSGRFMLPRTTRSWSNIGKLTLLTSHIAVACVSWSITWTSAEAQLTIFMVLCTQTQMTDIDILSMHCKSDSLVVRNASQLDRKHVVILRARCACSCHLASNVVGFDTCRQVPKRNLQVFR